MSAANVSFRLLTYSVDQQAPGRVGLLVGESVFDLDDELNVRADAGKRASFSAPSMLAVIENWAGALPLLREIAGNPSGAGKPLASVRLRAPLMPGSIFAAVGNYYDHEFEMSKTRRDKSEIEPFLIQKARATVIGPLDEIRVPQSYHAEVDWESEIAVVIGKAAKHVPVGKAMEHVAAYTIINDLSARNRGIRKDWNFGRDWFRQKSFHHSGPLGPWLTPADQVADPHKLPIRMWLNGDLMQDSSSEQMTFRIDELISILSHQVPLLPGDVIATGTCAGVGGPRGISLKPGDRLKISIGDLGTLENPVVAGD